MRRNDVETFAERFGFDAQALRPRTGALRRAGALSGMLLGFFGALALPEPAAAQTSGICDRTQIVQDEIVNTASGVSRCQDVTATHLESITGLGFSGVGLASLQAGDFAGLSNLQKLFLHSNPLLTSLPAGLFAGLTTLTTNAFFFPALLDVSLERVDSNPLSEGTPVKFKVSVAQGVLRDTTVRWRAIARDGLVDGKQTVSGMSEIKAGETDSGEFSIAGTRDTDGKPPRILVIVDTPRFGQGLRPAEGLDFSVPNAVSLDFGAGSATDRVAVYVLDAYAEEGNDIGFHVRLSEAASSDLTLNWNTADGTALGTGSSADYTPQSNGSLTIAVGATEGTITVSTVEDLTPERHETFDIELEAPPLPAGAVLATDKVVGTIRNDDTETALEDVTVLEGQEIRLPYNISFPTRAAWRSIVTAAHGTTNTKDVSFRNCISGSCSTGNTALRSELYVGSTGTYVRIGTALRDDETEGDEYFTVTVEGPPDGYPAGQGLTFKNGKRTARVTIRDTVPATLSIADAAAAEGDDVRIALTLSKALAVDAYIVWYTTGGTATSSDYLRRYPRRLTIPAGQTSVPLAVHTREDANPEPDETFTVRIERPADPEFQSPVLFGKNEATGTIRNDDARISLADADAAAEEGEAIEFTVTLDHPVAADVALDWQTGDDTAGDDPALSADDPNTGDKADYTPVSNGSLTIPAGDNSGTFTVQT